MKCYHCGVDVGLIQRSSPEGGWGDSATGLLVERETGADHSPDRCASPRLTPAERETLREVVDRRALLDEVLSDAAIYQGYGFMRPDDPRDFNPDVECCTPQEIENHRLACEAFERGEPLPEQAFTPDAATVVNGAIVHTTGGPWGIGGYTMRDPEMIELRDATRNAVAIIARLLGEA